MVMGGKPSVSEGGGAGGHESPPSLESRVGGWWLAGNTFHSHFERGRWWWWVRISSVTQITSGRMVVKPPSRVSSEGGAGDGRESPPSLELRVGGW